LTSSTLHTITWIVDNHFATKFDIKYYNGAV
jgi:hypothetical protein